MFKKKVLYNQRAFTLVELIVVITILAILGTIAFISLQGYSANSRDSVRISDISQMKKSLSLFMVQKGFYPSPSDSTNIVYQGQSIWEQGVFGDSVVTNVDSFNKKPLDPLLDVEYGYSVEDGRTNYELGGILEGAQASHIFETTHANTSYLAIVEGDYNGIMLSVSTGGTDSVLALPSIMASDLSDTSISNIVSKNGLVYNNYYNLPENYSSSLSSSTSTGGFDFQPSQLEVFSGSISDLGSQQTRIEFIKNLQEAYSGTVIASESHLQQILNLDPDIDVTGADDFTLSLLSSTIYSDVYNNLFEPPNPTWSSLDTNCSEPDIQFGGITWAGCNSTLGDGSLYAGSSITESDGSGYLYGKLYLLSERTSACTSPWRLPTSAEVDLINNSSDRINLKIPLSGGIFPDIGSDNRGIDLFLYSSTPSGNPGFPDSYNFLSASGDATYIVIYFIDFAASVRCVKESS